MPTSIAGVDLGFEIPTFTRTNIGFWATILAVIILFAVILCILVWMYVQHKKYFIKIRDFENISGQGFQLAKRDTARLVKVGDGGEELLLLRKRKTFRTAYGRKMGKNEYWFCRGQDGYWYNCVLGDLDAKLGMLDIEPIDRDMRYMHVAIRKNIESRYKKKEGIEKYVPIIISFIFLIIMIVAVWLLISKVGDLIVAAQQTIAAAEPTAQALSNAASKLDAICSSSGISPAG